MVDDRSNNNPINKTGKVTASSLLRKGELLSSPLPSPLLVMKTLHVKNLEKYHPSYKDRSLIWCKVYFKMVNSDPEFEMLCEIDKWRFVAFIMLELQMQKPIPLDNEYLRRKGFDLKTRPIYKTISMLHSVVEVCDENVTYSRVEKSREEEDVNVTSFWAYFLLKTKKKYTLTPDRQTLITNRLKSYPLTDLKKAVDNFVNDKWEGRKDNLDIIYCLGKQKGKPDNLEKWLNNESKGTGWKTSL